MLVFLSHSGSDSAAAKTLKDRIEASPAAQARGVKVWLDLDELRPGDEWQPGLEAALEQADAFIVYVGSGGVVNWVDRELRHALTRATGPDAIPFIPLLATSDLDETVLPPFVRQFQAVTDPLGDADALARLVASLVDGAALKVAVTDRPFVGLSPMTEAEADRFFGRDAEIEQLCGLMQQHALIAVVADSGAGKSSLVRAGLVPAFRGGALVPDAALSTAPPRHVVVMRPGGDPIQGLRDGVDKAARTLGKDAGTRRALRQSVKPSDPGETFYALACDIDDDQPDILLVVDQFEELLTATSPEDATAFINLLLALVDNPTKPLRCVLTVRVDYFNLIRNFEALFARLTTQGGAAQMRLKRVSDAALDDIVTRPLRMGGHSDTVEQAALAAAIRRDITDRPGDLALVQMALYATWRRHVESGSDLMTAYGEVNGVLGALAHQAEQTRQTLDTPAQDALLALFVRLVRLGDTGGATRRIAALNDLDPERAELAQRLAGEQAGRLLMIGDETVEIAHEALVSQWPWLQAHIQKNAEQIRSLARLGDRTQTWKQGGSAALPNDSERQEFEALAATHPDWLADEERACLKAATRKASVARWTRIAASVTIVLFGLAAGIGFLQARNAQQIAEQAALEEVAARDAAARNAAGGLAALSNIAASQKRWLHAIALALAAWPRNADSGGVQVPDPVDTLSRALPVIASSQSTSWPSVYSARAEISKDGGFYAYQPNKKAALTLFRTGDPTPVFSRKTYPRGTNFALSPDARFFVATTTAPYAILQDLTKAGDPIRLTVRSNATTAVAISPESDRIYVAIEGGFVNVFDVNGRPIQQFRPVNSSHVWALAAHPDGKHLFVGDRYGRLTLWSLERSQRVYTIQGSLPDTQIYNIELSADGVLLAVHYGTERASTYAFFDARSGERLCCIEEGISNLSLAINGTAMVSHRGQTHFVLNGEPRRLRFSTDLSETIPNTFGRRIWAMLLGLSLDGRHRFEVSESGRLEIRNLQTDLIEAEYDDRFGPILTMRAVSQTELMLVHASGQSRILDLSKQPDVTRQPLGDAPSDNVWISRNKAHVVTRTGLGPLKVWRFKDASLVATIDGVQADSPVSISDTGQTLVARRDTGELAAFDLRGAPGDPASVQNLAEIVRFRGAAGTLSPDGRWLAFARNDRTQGYVAVTDTVTGKLVLDEEFQIFENAFVQFPDTGDFLWVGSQRFDLTEAAKTQHPDATLDVAKPIDVFLQNLATSSGIQGTGVLTPDKTRLALLGENSVDVLDTATGAALAQLPYPNGQFLALDFPSPETLRALTHDGLIMTWNLSHIAQGNAFEVACQHFSDATLEEALNGFPITVAEPICDADYNPPIPEWMAPAHDAINLPRAQQ